MLLCALFAAVDESDRGGLGLGAAAALESRKSRFKSWPRHIRSRFAWLRWLEGAMFDAAELDMTA